MRNIRTLFLTTLMIVVELATFSQSSDFESWTDIGLRKKVNKKLSLKLEESIRLNQNSQQIKSLSTDLKAGYNVNKNLEVDVTYRPSMRRKPNGYFHKHRGNVDVTLKNEFNQMEISFRNRFQIEKDSYVTKEEDLYPKKENRNRLKLAYNILGVKTDPFISVEFFHQLTRPRFYEIFETRYQLGFSHSLPDNYKLNFGFIYKRAIKQTIENRMILNIAFSKSI